MEEIPLDSMELDYCRFNTRGFKQYRKHIGAELPEGFASFSTVDLPAHKAAFEGNIKALEAIFIWKHSKGVPSVDKLAATPLHIAARLNQTEAIKWLVRYTTLSVLDKAEQNETPVHVASALGHLESVKALLGSDEKDLKQRLSDIQDKSGYTCLFLAIKKIKNNVVKFLVNELGPAAVTSFNNTGINAAHIAASSGNIDALKIIANKYKKTLHERTSDGTTPAYFAAQEGKLEVLQYLHETAKCDLSISSGEAADNLKPIHAAAQGGHTNIIKYIVSKLGIDIMLDPTPDGGTPLHFASSAGKLKTVRWLVNHDVSGLLISAQDDNGDTPAHDAAGAGRVEVLKFLLENGADMMQTNKSGSTPYSNALGSTNPEMANFVVTYSAKAAIQEEEKEDTDIVMGGITADDDDDISPYDVTSSTYVKDVKTDDEHTTENDVVEEIDLPSPVLDVTHDYATVNEIKENEKRRSNKSSRGVSKSIQNALKPLRKKKRSREETEFGEMGYKPTHRLNPLSKLRKGGDKTPTAPPSTPATQSSENAQDVAVISELDHIYSTVDEEVVTRKRRSKVKYTDGDPPEVPSQNFEGDEVRAIESSSHISLGSATSSDKSEKMDLLDDSIVVIK